MLGYVGEINEDELTAQPKSAQYELGDTIGKGGVELTYESDLRGTPGSRAGRGRQHRAGHPHARRRTSPKPGNDVRLTLDLDVQKLAEDSLGAGHRRRRGTPRTRATRRRSRRSRRRRARSWCSTRPTGSVVAMASNPTYDPNEFVDGIPEPTWTAAERPGERLPAASTGRSPASTRRVRRSSSMTAIAGLQRERHHRRPRRSTTRGSYAYPTDPGRTFTTTTARLRRGRPGPGARRCRATSTSTRSAATSTTAKRHNIPGGDALQDDRREYGFGKADRHRAPERGDGPRARRGVEAEGPRRQPRRRSRTPTGCRATTSSSRSARATCSSTPLQLANAYAAFANGGTLCEPRLASEVLDASRQEGPRPRADHHRPGRRCPGGPRCSPGFTGVVEDDRRAPRQRRSDSGLPARPGRGQDRHRAGAGQAEHVVVRRHDPAAAPEVRRARGGRGGWLRRGDRGPDRPRGSWRA